MHPSVTLDLSWSEARHREPDSAWRRITFFCQREPQATIRLPLGSTAAPHTLAIVLPSHCHHIASSNAKPFRSLFRSLF
jgi:hypothetical protein